jgi:hypothetical protein
MIRKAASKFLILAAVTLASGAMAVNCSKNSTKDDIGSVGLALVLPGGGIVNTVNYTISGNGITPIMGVIDVSAPGTTQATALVSGLNPGMYTVSMTATGTMPSQTCMGTAPFTVVANQTAMANVILQCTRINPYGSVAINGRIDQCPLITSVSASSLQGVVGGAPIMIGVVASELDPGDTVTYNWTAAPTGIGTIGAQGANTTFTCTTAGSTQLSIAVSDGVCGDSVPNAIPINCTGTTGAGGAAGTGAGGGGAAGTGIGGGGAAGTGIGGGGAAGTGIGGGGAAGTGVGGGGAAGTGCLETNPPAALVASCTACLTLNGDPTTAGCCGIQATDPTGFALCQAASACMRAGGPPVGVCNVGGDVTTCFCGSNLASCDTAPNGPCIAQETAAAARNVMTMMTDAITPTPAQVQARIGDPVYALGRAGNIQTIAGAFCAVECGF